MQGDGGLSMKTVAAAVIQSLASLGIWGTLLFWPAGTLDWPRAWLHLAVWILTFAVNFAVLRRVNPEIIRQRMKRQRFASRFDLLLMVLVIAPAVLALPVVAGLDAERYGLSTIPVWVLGLAVVVHVLGDAVMVWAMAANPFLVKTVRIQSDRGHRVISTGPYAYVRHPMYVGVSVMFLAIPCMLGSAYALIPASVFVAGLVARTAWEDKLLQCELDGYRDYAARVRYRLVPGIW